MARASGGGAADAAEKRMEKAILAIAAENPEGFTTNHLNAEAGHLAAFPLAQYPLQFRVTSLNQLLAQAKIVLFTKPDGSTVFKAAQASDAKTKGLNTEEQLVYQEIRAAGDKGIWTRDIKMKTNLGQPQVNKIIKTLEGRGLIKAVKNVNNPSKKLYMLAELEPSTEITGGAWYSHQQLDLEFITQLTEACFTIITRRPNTSLKDITHTINVSGLARVKLGEDEIRTVINTLIADCRVEATEHDDGLDRYRPAVLALPTSTPFTSIPCGVCPVIEQCSEGGQVSPQTCVYYQKWLEF